MREHAHYGYTQPETGQGKRCVAQCLQGKSYCEDLCVMKHPECKKNAGKAGLDECKKLCHCTYAYNICYTACGGKVY